MSSEKIILYTLAGCPFCNKVRSFLESHKLAYEEIEVPMWRDDPVRQELSEKSGVGTVPVIKVNGEYIGDSQIIIDYLKEKVLKE